MLCGGHLFPITNPNQWFLFPAMRIVGRGMVFGDGLGLVRSSRSIVAMCEQWLSVQTPRQVIQTRPVPRRPDAPYGMPSERHRDPSSLLPPDSSLPCILIGLMTQDITCQELSLCIIPDKTTALHHTLCAVTIALTPSLMLMPNNTCEGYFSHHK